MENRLGAHLSPEERKTFLLDNCDRQEEFRYIRQFGADELERFRVQLSDVLIEIDNIEEEKKEVVKGFSDALKPLKESLKTILTNLRSRSEEVTEQCYVIHDYDSRQVGHYNENGELVNSRPMRPQETQGKLFTVRHYSEADCESEAA